jgi:hypothetical protein
MEKRLRARRLKWRLLRYAMMSIVECKAWHGKALRARAYMGWDDITRNDIDTSSSDHEQHCNKNDIYTHDIFLSILSLHMSPDLHIHYHTYL